MGCFSHFDFHMCFGPQRRARFQLLNIQKWSERGVFSLGLLTSKYASRHNSVHFFETWMSKTLWSWGALYILTWTCPSRQNSLHFFNISRSKSVPEHCVLCTFWLGNVVRATSACTFSTPQRPKVLLWWCVLLVLTWKWWKCASRDNCVHFFNISAAKGVPSIWCFYDFDFEMCFKQQRRAVFHYFNV